MVEEADSKRWSSGLDRGRGRRGGAAHDRVPGCLRASRHQARTRRRRTGSTTCTRNSWLTAGAAAKRALLSQCGFSRSEVRGISSMTLTSGTPPRAPATTTRKWQGRRRRRRGRWLALVRFAAMPVAISGSVHRESGTRGDPGGRYRGIPRPRQMTRRAVRLLAGALGARRVYPDRRR